MHVESDRRELFRNFIGKFNPTVNPLAALKSGLYVPHPLGTASRIGHRLELEPTSSHLLVGGIGSGKTTELLRAKSIVDVVPDLTAIFLDVPALQSVSALGEGVLVALAFRGIVDGLKKSKSKKLSDLTAEINHGNDLSMGYWASYDDQEHDSNTVHVKGLLTLPAKNTAVEQLVEIVSKIVKSTKKHFVVFFDGLDRVRKVDEFAKMVLRDLDSLQSIGVGIVIVGPQALNFEKHKHIVEKFTAFHLHGAADMYDTEGSAFLEEVLRRRAPETILPQDSRFQLSKFSGGLLRDLISLTRDTGEIAYTMNSSFISNEHVEHASERYGRALILGISSAVIKDLLSLQIVLRRNVKEIANRGPSVNFVAATEQDIALLLHRLVIEVPAIPIRYYIHPTVQPHLNSLRRSFNG